MDINGIKFSEDEMKAAFETVNKATAVEGFIDATQRDVVGAAISFYTAGMTEAVFQEIQNEPARLYVTIKSAVTA